jgi:hypothetical protein
MISPGKMAINPARVVARQRERVRSAAGTSGHVAAPGGNTTPVLMPCVSRGRCGGLLLRSPRPVVVRKAEAKWGTDAFLLALLCVAEKKATGRLTLRRNSFFFGSLWVSRNLAESREKKLLLPLREELDSGGEHLLFFFKKTSGGEQTWHHIGT